jgi:hypothetical protein
LKINYLKDAQLGLTGQFTIRRLLWGCDWDISSRNVWQKFFENIDILEDKMSFKGTVVIKKEDEWVVAICLENNIASQGKTIDEAIENLK